MWGLAGLGHDLDSEQTEQMSCGTAPSPRTSLRGLGLPEEAVHAVAACKRRRPAWWPAGRFDVALLAADQLSGLVTAAALVRPDKDLAGVNLKSL